jgi:hypothetical protein
MPADENILSALIKVVGIVFRALYNFSKFSGLFFLSENRNNFRHKKPIIDNQKNGEH